MPDAEQQPAPERRPVSWEARQLVADYGELKGMSEAEINRYSGRRA